MRRGIAAVGRALITIGLLILLFVAFQLWGTGIVTARAQSDMRSEFEDALASTTSSSVAPATSTTTAAPTPTTGSSPTLRDPPALPSEGEWVGTIEIPKISINKIFVEGTGREDLKKGPGHYPGTPLPGQVGNAAIAGHRTTYGHPFFDLDQLARGDKIITTSVAGRYTYEVRDTLIVHPEDTYVVDNTPDAQLTLTTCNPKYSARERLVIKAVLVPEKSSPVSGAELHQGETSEGKTLAEGLDSESKPLGPAYGWGAIVAVVGVAWWWVFRRWRHPFTWVAGVLPFLVVLFGFYYFLERVLPAGY